jgi:hypothetical protein
MAPFEKALLITGILSVFSVLGGYVVYKTWEDASFGTGLMNVLRLNLKPIALIVCCTAIGGIFGAFFTGFLVGVAIVAFATTIA